MKKRYGQIILLFFLAFFLQACIPSAADRLQEGFNHLKAGEITSAREAFISAANFSSNATTKALAREGLGWCYYLEGNFPFAETYFSQAVATSPDKKEVLAGLSLTKAKIGKLSESVNNGLFILSTTDDILVDYLPDPLEREEFLKFLTVVSLISGSADYEELKGEISDTGFLNKLVLLEGGE
ncbi:tetratricopeptide repeat protein [Kosmotoga pacifica]|uniref:Uncharacterized protein n=1 Tax=Kosmotoga pacifica TaxID=1330330 RepID=A0A0G2Z637_9BACT|nr:tetratricopeptide repeat protein [Kosmotoga pacifica]AKI97070.1 hypothetical protein IX53_03670 [Kosmotoga pacifica]